MQSVFKLGDRLGNGGLADVELARRAGNVAAFGDGIKNVVKIKILFHKFPFPAVFFTIYGLFLSVTGITDFIYSTILP